MAVTRRAEVNWQGNLTAGKGTLSAVSSDAFTKLPITWASRTESPDGRTSPEELLASAHASCFAMAFSSDLTKAGFPPDSLEVSCEVGADRIDGKFTVLSSSLTVRGRVPGLDQAKFAELANGAKENCPISRSLKGNVQLNIDAKLESGVAAG
jgi:lipoyl-dependent peroxiredoxin